MKALAALAPVVGHRVGQEAPGSIEAAGADGHLAGITALEALLLRRLPEDERSITASRDQCGGVYRMEVQTVYTSGRGRALVALEGKSLGGILQVLDGATPLNATGCISGPLGKQQTARVCIFKALYMEVLGVRRDDAPSLKSKVSICLSARATNNQGRLHIHRKHTIWKLHGVHRLRLLRAPEAESLVPAARDDKIFIS